MSSSRHLKVRLTLHRCVAFLEAVVKHFYMFQNRSFISKPCLDLLNSVCWDITKLCTYIYALCSLNSPRHFISLKKARGRDDTIRHN